MPPKGFFSRHTCSQNALANEEGRRALMGAERQTFDLFSEILTKREWAEMLQFPLECAAAQGNVTLTQKLLRAGADMGSALHAAVRYGHVEVVTNLLEHGACVSTKDARGSTPLQVAAVFGYTEVIQSLLRKGAKKDLLNAQECTPLYGALLFGHLTSARALLAAGADVNVRCGLLKRTVLSLAAEKGDVDILRALVKNGADVTAVDNDRDTALHVAVQFNRAEVIDALVEMGANIEASNRIGCTPLHLACHMLRDQAVVALSKRGANINARDVVDQTPLHHASSVAGEARGTSAVVDLLLRLGADETIVDKRNTNAAGLLTRSLWACLYPGDAERVHKLLCNAPADRAWRRRGFLLLCRAYPERVPPRLKSSSTLVDAARTTHNEAKFPRLGTTCCGDDTMVDESFGDGWADVVFKVLTLPGEDVFRAIVGYL
ncbi:unnamed protein product [Ectocarpus sp. 12 AP-2014]